MCGCHQVQQLFKAGLTSKLEQVVGALSDQVLMQLISSDGDSNTSLGNLFQC